ncbi:hypothetical protein COOONC_20509 [Cooperia oncophora]
MFRCDETGIRGLADTIRKNSISLKEIEATGVESVKKAVLAGLADELQGTEADHEIEDAIEQCQKNLRKNDLYGQLRNCFPLNLRNPHKFKRKGSASKQQLRQFLEELVNVFPRGFIGEKNSKMLLDSVLNEVTAWKSTTALKIFTKGLRVLECKEKHFPLGSFI